MNGAEHVKHVARVRLAKILLYQGKAEGFFNQQRVLYVPAGSDFDALSFRIHIRGFNVQIDKITATGWLPQKD